MLTNVGLSQGEIRCMTASWSYGGRLEKIDIGMLARTLELLLELSIFIPLSTVDGSVSVTTCWEGFMHEPQS